MLSNSQTGLYKKNQHFFIAEPPLQQNLSRMRIPYEQFLTLGAFHNFIADPAQEEDTFQTVHLQVKSERQGAKFTGKSSLQSKCKTKHWQKKT
jgi:hypothetical protein